MPPWIGPIKVFLTEKWGAKWAVRLIRLRIIDRKTERGRWSYIGGPITHKVDGVEQDVEILLDTGECALAGSWVQACYRLRKMPH